MWVKTPYATLYNIFVLRNSFTITRSFIMLYIYFIGWLYLLKKIINIILSRIRQKTPDRLVSDKSGFNYLRRIARQVIRSHA